MTDLDTAPGHDDFSTIPQQVGSDSDWIQIALGTYHIVALRADRSLWVWGRNIEGQLGDGTGVNSPVPLRIGADNDWVEVAAGGFHTVARKADGTLWVWGENIKGQLGDGTNQKRLAPVQVGTGDTWLAISAGNDFTLAIRSDRTLWSWGDNSFGQLGYDSSTDADPAYVTMSRIPQKVGTKNDWDSVAAGMYHVLALDAAADLWAWGHNDWGQLGNGSTVAALAPIQVTSGITWRKIDAGNYFSLALKTDDTLWTWGANDWGQLGDGGGLGFFRSSPTQAGDASGWLEAAAGAAHTLAVQADGSFQGWGSNQNGQLGDGTLDDTVARTVTINDVLTPTNSPAQTIAGTVDLQTVRVSIAVADADGNVIQTGDATLAGTSWSYDLTGLIEGANTIIVTATDAALFDTAQAMAVIHFDSTRPEPPVVSGSTPANSPAWSWTSAGGGNGTFRYKLDDGDLTQGATETTGTYFVPEGLLSEQVHTLYIQERDEAGNWSTSGSLAILVDRTSPGPPQVSGSSASNDETPTWSWTSGGGGSGAYRYKLDDNDLTVGTTGTAEASFSPAENLPQGIHTLYVQERDEAGNWSGSGSFSIEVDITEPVFEFYPVVTPTNDSTQIVYGTVEVGATVQITIGGSAASEATVLPNGTWLYEITDLQEGENSIEATATDAAGNSSRAEAVIAYDATPPGLPAVSGTTPTNVAAPTWNWTSGGGGNGLFRFKLDDSDLTVGATEAGITSFTPDSALSHGSHTLYVQERDVAGNWSGSGSFEIDIDLQAPMLTFDFYSTPIHTDSQTIWGRREAWVEVSSTTGPVSYPTPDTWSLQAFDLDPGINAIEVVAIDAAGNTTRVDREVHYEPAAPILTIDSLATPVGVSSQTISGRRSSGSIVSILVNGSTQNTVAYPTTDMWSSTLTGLAEGANTIAITGTESNNDLIAEVFATIIYNPSAPPLTLDALVSPSRYSSQAIGGSRPASVEVSVTADFWATVEPVVYPTETTWTCTIYNLIEAENSISITTENDEGFRAALFRTILYDVIAPSLTVDQPGSLINHESITLTGTAEPDATVRIENETSMASGMLPVTDGAWTYTLTGLVPGNNSIRVIAADAAGNASEPVVISFYYDNIRPTVTILAPETGRSYHTPVLNYTVADDYAGELTTVATILGAGAVTNNSSISGLADGDYHLQVVATDAAGNQTTEDVVFTVDTVPPALTLNEVVSPAESPIQTISGTSEAGATINVHTSTAASDGSATVNPDGTWSYEITGLEVGDNTISVVAIDSAGNESEPANALLTREVAPDQIIEDIGHLAVSGVSRSFYTATSRQNPVVIVGPPTNHDPAPGVVRVSNTTDFGFEARFQEWNYLDGPHAEENIPFLVLAEGIYEMGDSIWEVGSFTLTGVKQYALHSFSQTFDAPPALFLTVQSANEADAVTVRARNVAAGSFEAALFEQEASTGGHTEEKIGYLAIYSPTGSGRASIGGVEFPYLLQQRNIGSTFAPVLSSSLKLEEETSADAETSHVVETVSVLALGPYQFAQVTGANEADTAAVRRQALEDPAAVEWGALVLSDNEWVTVPLARGYNEPVVVAKPVSANNPEPGFVQIGNVTETSFDIRHREWIEGDAGRRQPVQLFYLVSESGSQSIGGLTIEAGKVNSDRHYPAWQPVDFASEFSEAPAVFASFQTVSTGLDLVTRVQNVTDRYFETAMQGAEAYGSGDGEETIGWIAVEKGSALTGDGRKLLVTGTTVGNSYATIDFTDHYTSDPIYYNLSEKFIARYKSFSEAFSVISYLQNFQYENPVLIGDLNTTNEADTAVLGYRNLRQGGVELTIQEETSLDAEVQHAPEEVSLFLVE